VSPKCYKSHTCTLGQREREGEGGRREAREGGMHRCPQNVIKCTRAPTGREKERVRKEGREAREGGR